MQDRNTTAPIAPVQSTPAPAAHADAAADDDACGCGHDHHTHDHGHHHHHHAPVATFTRAAPKVGRNDACPCGSGRKHKHCCLKA